MHTFFQLSLDEFFHEEASAENLDEDKERELRELAEIASHLMLDDISVLKQVAKQLAKKGKQ